MITPTKDSTADLAVALTFATVRKIVPGVAAVKNGAPLLLFLPPPMYRPAHRPRSLCSLVGTHAGDWKTWSPFWMASPFDVTGSTVGVVGLGRIGT
jgi:lactate dehydrogenase-like 2-hydroxyacid dehydrogenase